MAEDATEVAAPDETEEFEFRRRAESEAAQQQAAVAPPVAPDHPQTPAEYGAQLGSFDATPEQPSFASEHPILENATQAAIETAQGFIPKTVEQVASFVTPAVQGVENIGRAGKSIYDVLFGGQTPSEAATTNFPESRILAEAEQTPPYSKERFGAGFNIASQMLMAKGFAGGLRGIFYPGETAEAAPLTEAATGAERPPVETAGETAPATQAAVAKTEEVTPNASEITSTTGVPEPEVRAHMGEEAPLRQPGETTGTREGAEAQPQTEATVAPETASEQPATDIEAEKPPVQTAPSGISTERLQGLYGKDAVLITKGHSPEALQAKGASDTRDPYALLSKAQQTGIAHPDDVPALRVEHSRLLQDARNAYGSPEYGELAQRAVDFGNAVKEVAHGPASEIFRAIQDVDKPRYDSPADFDNIWRERMKNESPPEAKEVFQKASDDVKNAQTRTNSSIDDAQSKLRQYKPREKVSFEDAVDDVRSQIEALTKDCIG